MKPISNPPIMSRSDSGSDVSSSSSDGSDNERSTNRELVIPPPVELSDSSDDGVSPSLHKLAMLKQLSRKNVQPKSISGSDEEEEVTSLLMDNPELLLIQNHLPQCTRRLPR